MDEPIVGSEAVAGGALTRGQLRWNYRPIFPDVYIPKNSDRTLELTTIGAWLWSERRSTVTGRAAAALHGATWVDETAPIELLWRNNHCPPGIIARDERFAADEVATIRGLAVATPARTGFDLSRHLNGTMALAHLDDLARATRITRRDLIELLERYPRARGAKRARPLIDMMDAGSESPKESWLRLVLISAGLPPPTTQIRVSHGPFVAYLDMGWATPMVAVEYDGDHHRLDRNQYVKDIRRAEILERLGWHVIRVIKEDRPNEIVERVSQALAQRGFAGARRNRSYGRGIA